MQIPLLRGRFFATSEGEQSQPVAIINQTLAEQYWPNENPIGKEIRVHLQQSKAVPWRPSVGDSWITIVGIVGDVQEREWAGGKVGEIYLPYLQVPSRLMRLAVRTSGSPMLLAEPLRQVIASIDKNQPVTEIKTMEEWLSEAVSSDKMNTTLLSFFAALALILAAIGIYGVVSYSVGQRSHEIGIRMALGAQRNDILRLVVGHGLGLALAGSAIGLIAAYGATHLLSSFLFGVHSMDPLTTFSAVALMIVVALAACYIPARRATRIDPMQSLRYE
jgi:putative ABC transport system permease protein